MKTLEPKIALGLYSDSSAVYINACLLKTDGLDILDTPIELTRPYSPELRESLLHLRYPNDFTDGVRLKTLDEQITKAHISVAQELIEQTKRHISKIDIIGYSGHSVLHRASDKLEISLGNGDRLAQELHIPVIDHFVQTDLKAGGTGGPLLPSFWQSVTKTQEKPIGIISLSGISTITFIGELGELLSFDVGVGCLLLDRWMQRHTGLEMDFDGSWTLKGQVDERLLSYLLKTPYLLSPPPKTVAPDDFNRILAHLEGCSPADGAATLTAFIVQSIVNATRFLPTPPQKWLLCGGGVFNPVIVMRLKQSLAPAPAETMAEAQMPYYNLDAGGYAFLATRSLMALPITFPGTTGVSEPLSGGQYHAAEEPEERQ